MHSSLCHVEQRTLQPASGFVPPPGKPHDNRCEAKWQRERGKATALKPFPDKMKTFRPKCVYWYSITARNAIRIVPQAFLISPFILGLRQYLSCTAKFRLLFYKIVTKTRRHYGYDFMGGLQAPQETRRDVQSQDQSVSQWDDGVYADTYFHLWYLYPILFFRIAVL